MRRRNRSSGKKRSRLFGAQPDILLLDEQVGRGVSSEETDDEYTDDPGITEDFTDEDTGGEAFAPSPPIAPPTTPAVQAPKAPAPTLSRPTGPRSEHPAPASRAEGPAMLLGGLSPDPETSAVLLDDVLVDAGLREGGGLLLEDEGTDDEPTLPEWRGGRDARIELTEDDPTVAAAPWSEAGRRGEIVGPALLLDDDDDDEPLSDLVPPQSSAGYTLLPSDEDLLLPDEEPTDEHLIISSQVRGPAPATPDDEDLTGPPPGRSGRLRFEMEDLPTEEDVTEDGGPDPRTSPMLLDDEDDADFEPARHSGPAVYIHDEADEPQIPDDEYQLFAVSSDERGGRLPPEDGATPLRIFVGAQGDEDAITELPPGVWDVTSSVTRQDSDEVFVAGAADEYEEDTDELADDYDDGRSGGELPRTWMDPLRLPAALDRNFGRRPARVGGVVQAVPGTPSALAIAREEAEASRFGPPPPLRTPPPFVMGISWNSPPELGVRPPPAPPVLPPRDTSGFQLVSDSAPRSEPAMVVGDRPRPQAAPPPPPRAAAQASLRPAQSGVRTALLLILFTVVALWLASLFKPRIPTSDASGSEARPGSGETEVAAPAPDESVDAAASDGASSAPIPAPTEAPAPVEPAPPVEAPVAVTPPTSTAPGTADATLSLEEREAAARRGQVIVKSNRAGTVYIGNKRIGSTPGAPLELEAGTYTIRVSAGGQSRTKDVRVDAGQLRIVEYKFQ